MGSKCRKKQGPFLTVKAGSAVVPIYRTESKGRVRFTLSFYRDGRRVRKMFNNLEDAKKEALFVAQRIQVGMQHVTDLKPHERDSFKAAEAMLRKSGIPLVAAVEDYLRARDLAGTQSLAAMAAEYTKCFGNITRRATVPEVVTQLLESRKQDGAGKRHLAQLRSVLNRFPLLDHEQPVRLVHLRGEFRQIPVRSRADRHLHGLARMAFHRRLDLHAERPDEIRIAPVHGQLRPHLVGAHDGLHMNAVLHRLDHPVVDHHVFGRLGLQDPDNGFFLWDDKSGRFCCSQLPDVCGLLKV